MKTKVLTMTVAALLTAGCSQNEVTDVNPDSHPAIGFDAYTGVPTKGTDTNLTSLKDNTTGNFGILAYYTGAQKWETASAGALPNFMYNEKVYWSTNTWKYDNLKYWPNNEDHWLTFFAYGPYEAAPGEGTNKGIVISGKGQAGIPYIDFSLTGAEKIEQMVDLVVSHKNDERYTDNSGTVNFKFSHILSKVSFKVQLKEALTNTKIFVRKLEILGKTNNTSSAFYTKAKYANLHWSYDDTNIPNTDFDLAKIMDVATISENKDYTKDAIEVTTEAKSLFKDGQSLFLIPVKDSDQASTETGTTSAGEIQVRLTYDLATPDQNDESKYLTSETEAIVDLPVGALKLGTAYVYTFKLGLKPVNISVDGEIEEWTDGTTGDTGNI